MTMSFSQNVITSLRNIKLMIQFSCNLAVFKFHGMHEVSFSFFESNQNICNEMQSRITFSYLEKVELLSFKCHIFRDLVKSNMYDCKIYLIISYNSPIVTCSTTHVEMYVVLTYLIVSLSQSLVILQYPVNRNPLLLFCSFMITLIQSHS